MMHQAIDAHSDSVRKDGISESTIQAIIMTVCSGSQLDIRIVHMQDIFKVRTCNIIYKIIITIISIYNKTVKFF